MEIEKLPVHVGIIMDGNRRWAKLHGKASTEGHLEGLKAAKRIVKSASALGLRYLSLYTFSTENWKRAEKEVNFLLSLIRRYLKREYDFYRRNEIRVVQSGNIEKLPENLQKEIENVEKDTAHFPGLTVNLAINYGGRDEIARAVLKMHNDKSIKSTCWKNEAEIYDQLTKHLDHPEIPEPDLIIRTGGEQRISNFLLWQSAYSELYFTNKLWPEWDKEDLITALKDYSKRNRRFGGSK
ncbi:MAG: di-trans,poly-cis-decaprenylcistransferase [Spirochaetales bacterium]|nr:di-trans,poly-cis-decaprenylcistransferase [Spirochaetales bacterium]RKX81893.1 MAG: di-trans,poly-cis-decaprenylcistransferase [Spirochaetota bacterium]